MSSRIRAIRRNYAGEIADNRRTLQPARDDVFDNVGRQITKRTDAVSFDAVVAIGRGLDYKSIGDRTIPTFVNINGVITNVNGNVVFETHRTTKHFNAIVEC